MKEIVISREQAVFWMDAQGCWRSRQGKFRHPRVIDYFNKAIRKDDGGYYVTQIRGKIREKVYFHHEDTPLFAVDMVTGPDLTLVLNTGEKIPLDPSALFTIQDSLYSTYGDDEDERVKFADRALMKITDFLEETPDGLYIEYQNRRYPVKEYAEPRSRRGDVGKKRIKEPQGASLH